MRWSPIGEYIGPSKESLLWEVVGSVDVVVGVVVDVEAVVVVVGCSYFMALHSRPGAHVAARTMDTFAVWSKYTPSRKTRSDKELGPRSFEHGSSSVSSTNLRGKSS